MLTSLQVEKIKNNSLKNELIEMTQDKDYFVRENKKLKHLLTERDIKISEKNKLIKNYKRFFLINIILLTVLIWLRYL